MFVKDDAKFLHKHYCALVKQEMEPHLHHLIELEHEYTGNIIWILGVSTYQLGSREMHDMSPGIHTPAIENHS
jgi:hypothetical protein